ncbi:MAG: AraC family transcriptional regulator [Thermoflexibacter sp.]
MKALIKKSVDSPVHSFMVRELIEPQFDPTWHFHPHYQLFTVLDGNGTRFVGDNIRLFMPEDTVFLGPNIPHVWRSDYSEKNHAHGIVVYFTEDFLGKDFFEKPEMYLIKQLFVNSQRGLEIIGDTRISLQKSLIELVKLSGFDSILKLLSILNDLSHSTEYKYITTPNYVNSHKISETERMQKVHEYVMQHFKEEISLSELASLICMSESAFCRYFKSRTNKTFSDFVSEVRIGYACKLLMDNKLSVTQIALESGFNTISNFNRQFKNLMGKSPLQYQKEFLSQVMF